MRACPHPRQQERLAALRSLKILDTPREARYDEIVGLVAEICEAPIAVINLIDEKRQWFKAEVGLGFRETPLETSLCSHVILRPGLTIIHDTLADPRFCDNPLCIDEPNLRFYAGVALETEDKLPIGTLCVLDTRPRGLSQLQQKCLTVLGNQVVTQINMSKQLLQAVLLQQEVDHRVKNSLGVIQSLLRLQMHASGNDAVAAELKKAGDRIMAVMNVHDELHRTGQILDVDIGSFVSRLARSLSNTAGGGVTIDVAMPSATVAGKDATNAGLIINELVTNAVRHGFGASGGHIRIVGEMRGSRLLLSVIDNGEGLPPEFHPAKSTGLGMRVALLLVKSFGGDLSWSSTDSGAQFSFEMPLTPT